MRIRGTLDRDGRIRLPSTPRLRMGSTPVWVEIPDRALHTEPEPRAAASRTALSKEAQQLLEELAEIRNRPLTDHELASSGEVREDRLDAFALRAEVRVRRDRP